MGNSKTDPRVVKTRNNLKKALVGLMRHYKIENISVQKITETAAVTRGTFYLHYKDKQDFIKRAMSEILDDFFDAVMISGDAYFAENDTGSEVQVFSLQKSFKYIENEAEVFDVLLNSEENELFFQQFYDRLTDQLNQFYDQLQDRFIDLEVPTSLQIAFVVSAELGLIKYWLHAGMIYTPHYMTQSVAKMLQQVSGDGIFFTDFFVAEQDGLLH
ncbi:TetR/AcrR family transcriptional regulator [Paucilactobacillus wasatchensis]|uniref:TetR family regulatory protein of MDR cluster n=1 Tax=Paucilactobacillus wasatchensis TaxID=1335616 RepID=A0A0D0YY55_9LACO|nr:TetR/AcrR family transcriptional regulator [Paucilactobacillus wasatchensis]KIS04124.1 TetR family regulatory protein of MDR cluster [Paucilactobacillus wasatchensis]